MPGPKKLYYPVWVSKTGSISLRWGSACNSPKEARQIGQNEVAKNRASISFVVEFANDEKTPMPTYTFPKTARRVIEHWEELWTATD